MNTSYKNLSGPGDNFGLSETDLRTYMEYLKEEHKENLSGIIETATLIGQLKQEHLNQLVSNFYQKLKEKEKKNKPEVSSEKAENSSERVYTFLDSEKNFLEYFDFQAIFLPISEKLPNNFSEEVFKADSFLKNLAKLMYRTNNKDFKETEEYVKLINAFLTTQINYFKSIKTPKDQEKIKVLLDRLEEFKKVCCESGIPKKFHEEQLRIFGEIKKKGWEANMNILEFFQRIIQQSEDFGLGKTHTPGNLIITNKKKEQEKKEKKIVTEEFIGTKIDDFFSRFFVGIFIKPLDSHKKLDDVMKHVLELFFAILTNNGSKNKTEKVSKLIKYFSPNGPGDFYSFFSSFLEGDFGVLTEKRNLFFPVEIMSQIFEKKIGLDFFVENSELLRKRIKSLHIILENYKEKSKDISDILDFFGIDSKEKKLYNAFFREDFKRKVTPTERQDFSKSIVESRNIHTKESLGDFAFYNFLEIITSVIKGNKITNFISFIHNLFGFSILSPDDQRFDLCFSTLINRFISEFQRGKKNSDFIEFLSEITVDNLMLEGLSERVKDNIAKDFEKKTEAFKQIKRTLDNDEIITEEKIKELKSLLVHLKSWISGLVINDVYVRHTRNIETFLFFAIFFSNIMSFKSDKLSDIFLNVDLLLKFLKKIDKGIDSLQKKKEVKKIRKISDILRNNKILLSNLDNSGNLLSCRLPDLTFRMITGFCRDLNFWDIVEATTNKKNLQDNFNSILLEIRQQEESSDIYTATQNCVFDLWFFVDSTKIPRKQGSVNKTFYFYEINGKIFFQIVGSKICVFEIQGIKSAEEVVANLLEFLKLERVFPTKIKDDKFKLNFGRNTVIIHPYENFQRDFNSNNLILVGNASYIYILKTSINNSNEENIISELFKKFDNFDLNTIESVLVYLFILIEHKKNPLESNWIHLLFAILNIFKEIIGLTDFKYDPLKK